MKARPFYLAAVVLVFGALFLHFAALGQISQGVRYRARSVTVSEQQRLEMRAQADKFTHRGGLLTAGGFGLAASSLICVFVSFRRHEPASRSIPIVLLLCYLIILMLVLV